MTLQILVSVMISYDTALRESFYKSIKKSLFMMLNYTTFKQTQIEIFKYI